VRTPVVTPFRPPEPAAVNGATPATCRPEVMVITPQIAQEWAALNTRNRPVRYAKVAQFARDMKAGKWVLNGETVKIAANGDLLDGQHRIFACIQAGIAFETVVIRGLPSEAQDTIDTGVGRKMADQLALRGEKDTILLAAIARWSFKWLHGVRAQGGTDQEPSHAEMLALIDAEPRLREATEWANAARQRFKSVSGSVYGMAWLLFHGSDHLAAEVFLSSILTAADHPEGDPALAFRDRIWRARENGERLNQYEQLGYLILAWNAFREERPLSRLQAPKGGKFSPKTYPEPK
jgi:hypothetical protein